MGNGGKAKAKESFLEQATREGFLVRKVSFKLFRISNLAGMPSFRAFLPSGGRATVTRLARRESAAVAASS